MSRTNSPSSPNNKASIPPLALPEATDWLGLLLGLLLLLLLLPLDTSAASVLGFFVGLVEGGVRAASCVCV
jgi:hypothetical protein